MADEATAAATATTATIGEEALVAAVAAPSVEAASELDAPVVVEPGPPTKKAKPELTPEQRAMESKKRADRRRALDQRKKEAAAEEERVRAAEHLLQLQTQAKNTVMQEQAQAMLFYGHSSLGQHMLIPGTGTASGGSSSSSVTLPLPPRSTGPPSAPFGHELGAHSGRHAYQSRDGSPEVGESMSGPSPSSIDLNRAPANSKGHKNLAAAAMAGARNLFDDLSAARAQSPSTVQAPTSFAQTMPATQPPPVDTQEGTTACPGSINIEEEPLFVEGLTQAAAAQARARRVSKRTANYTEKEDKMIVNAWLTIGQDALTGAEQKGTAFWRRIYEYFHEHRKYGQERVEMKAKEIELKAMARAKEMEMKAQEVELKRQAEDNLIMNADLTNMSEAKRAWFEKRQKEILERPN
ncbi:hypothetical protein QYE76_022404 [Lolium multiflorum]|uniref:No apical meristem-associated C-terminal domain-containing protein n=1 Tax=Lolium multiflorum TaxID=4521 RepID=A0AAD8RAX8_LOLMU|nr:hypothetical protein QYE76_022404 [Lolium multiflorum]